MVVVWGVGSWGGARQGRGEGGWSPQASTAAPSATTAVAHTLNVTVLLPAAAETTVLPVCLYTVFSSAPALPSPSLVWRVVPPPSTLCSPTTVPFFQRTGRLNLEPCPVQCGTGWLGGGRLGERGEKKRLEKGRAAWPPCSPLLPITPLSMPSSPPRLPQ